MEGRRVEGNPEKGRLAQVVLAHPARLGGDLGRPELAVGFEEACEQDGHGFDRESVFVGELRELGELLEAL